MKVINYTNDCPGVRVGVDRMTVTATMTPIGWDGPCPPAPPPAKKKRVISYWRWAYTKHGL